MLGKNIKIVLFCNLFFACVRAFEKTVTQDQTTMRVNTLFDDADDIQKQLDNEAMDKLKYGKQKTIWVFHFPTQFPGLSTKMRPHRQSDLLNKRVTDEDTESVLVSLDYDEKQWDYKDQSKWGKWYPDCDGRSQSPVDLPADRLVKTRGARQMLFINYDAMPESLTMVNDGNSVKMTGKWHASHRPVIYGGAAHSRRYLFDSISLHWPSEHTVSGLHYPLESQAVFVSAEYASVDEALGAMDDKMALLGVASLFTFSNRTHEGLREMLNSAASSCFGQKAVKPHPLSYFSPPFKEYACYHGSLTSPPCTETVMWLVRARSMPIKRELLETIQEHTINGEKQEFIFRQTLPVNDRKIFFFN